MYLAYRPWQRLRPGYLIPLAAALFSTLWFVVLYGFQAMPNQYVAYAATAAARWLLLARRESGPARARVAIGVVFVAMLATSLLRPTDAVFLAVPLVLIALVPGGTSIRRRIALVAAVGAGLAVGWAQWAYEAEERFGGFASRLRGASENNRTGLHYAVDDQLRAIGGSVLCKDPCAADAAVREQLWLLVLVVLVAVGAVAAWRRGWRSFAVVPVLVGGSMAAQYLFLIDYAAPRFLTPTYALVSLPCALGVVWLCRRWQGNRRRLVVAGLVLVLVAHLAVQLSILRDTGQGVVQAKQSRASVGAWLDARLDAPCVVLTDLGSPATAYAAGCSNKPNRGRALRELIAGGATDIAVVTREPAEPGAFYADWPVEFVDGPLVGSGTRAYLWRP